MCDEVWGIENFTLSYDILSQGGATRSRAKGQIKQPCPFPLLLIDVCLLCYLLSEISLQHSSAATDRSFQTVTPPHRGQCHCQTTNTTQFIL